MIALILSLVASASPPAQDSPPELVGLAERWERLRVGLGVPGLAVGVVHGDEIVLLEAFGVRDVENELAVTVDTPFYIASITKTFVTTAVLQLVEDRKVELDAPVKSYLPRFALADAAATESLTVRDLLSHAQGLNHFPIVFLDAYSGEITEDRYYHFLAEATPTGRTGYSNVHFTLAGRIVEAVGGKPWREYLQDEVFTPAGMHVTTGYADEMYAREDVAFPTVFEGGEMVLSPVRKNDRTMHAAGGLGSSAHDLSRWLLLHLNGGKIDGKRLLRPETVFDMQQLQAEERQLPDDNVTRLGFGLGWAVGEYRGHRYMQHGGGYVGSSALISFLPDAKIAVAVVTNTDGAGNRLCQMISGEVIDRLLGIEEFEIDPADFDGLFAKQVSEAVAQPPAATLDESGGGLSLDSSAYAGVYLNEHWGTFTVEPEGESLRARLGDLRATLRFTGVDHFDVRLTRGMDGPAHFVLEGDAVGAVVLDVSGYVVRFDRD